MATSEVIQLPYARLSFPRLWTPRSFEEGQEPRYEASFLLDPSNSIHAAKIAEIKGIGKELIREVCKGKVPDDVRYCFGDGEQKEYDGYDDMFFISTNKKQQDGRPTVVDSAGNPVQSGDPGCPYGGCYVHATISLWSQNHRKYGRRVNGNLRAVKFVKDGAAFSAIKPVNVDTEFEDFGDSFEGFGIDPLADDEGADPLRD